MSDNSSPSNSQHPDEQYRHAPFPWTLPFSSDARRLLILRRVGIHNENIQNPPSKSTPYRTEIVQNALIDEARPMLNRAKAASDILFSKGRNAVIIGAALIIVRESLHSVSEFTNNLKGAMIARIAGLSLVIAYLGKLGLSFYASRVIEKALYRIIEDAQTGRCVGIEPVQAINSWRWDLVPWGR